ncbi:hypothetical protein J3E68DRAFT_411940, partial [Trichoderma sp. SZMC 28012]
KKACQTSIDIHPANAPEGRPSTGSRSSREKQLSIQQMHEASTAILSDGSRGPKNIHSWISRIYNHQPGWIRWLFWEPKQETNTIEMILL